MLNLTRRSLLAGISTSLAAQTLPFSGNWSPRQLAKTLLPREQWKPFPNISERAPWEAIPNDMRQSILAGAKGYAKRPWGDLPATLFMEFKRTGNRSHYEDVSFDRRKKLVSLVIGECIEGQGKYLDEISNGIWHICEESFWGVPASFANKDGLPDILDPTLELFAGETSALLAWVDYLLDAKLDGVSKLLRPRIRLEAEKRIIAPGLAHDDYGWMGLRSKSPVNNWNPWISSNWLITSLLLDANVERRTATVHKILRCLDRFLAGYPEDGGCDEGPSYWHRAGASLFDTLDWLRMASNGGLDFFAMPLVKEIGRYIYRAHIADTWFVNFADAPAKVPPSGDLIYRFGRAIGDQRMMAFGAWGERKPFFLRDSIGRVLPALFNANELHQAKSAAPLLRDVWFPQLQVMAARTQEGTAKGLYVAAQGGHNAESHNHNDVGNFIVYAAGQPAIIDIGVERYTAKTFSPQRYEIWTMQSAFHNCPTINGVMQQAGREFRATEVSHTANDAAAEFRLNIEKAYPASAGVRDWKRVIRLDRAAGRVAISDRYALAAGPKELTLTLMTPLEPRASSGMVELAPRVKVLFDPALLAPRIEKIAVTDESLKSVWGTTLYRLLLVAVNPKQEGAFEVRIEASH